MWVVAIVLVAFFALGVAAGDLHVLWVPGLLGMMALLLQLSGGWSSDTHWIYWPLVIVVLTAALAVAIAAGVGVRRASHRLPRQRR